MVGLHNKVRREAPSRSIAGRYRPLVWFGRSVVCSGSWSSFGGLPTGDRRHASTGLSQNDLASVGAPEST